MPPPGQVLAGILGSTVTFPYGPEGKHAGNYMQTMAASVAGMCAMGVLIQAMVWLGWPEPPFWQIVSHFNPFFYMIDGFRYGFFGFSDASPFLCVAVVTACAVLLSLIAVTLLARGWKLRH